MRIFAYVGAGAFIHGVPARDLTGEEWDALDIETQRVALARSLYVLREDTPPDEAEKE